MTRNDMAAAVFGCRQALKGNSVFNVFRGMLAISGMFGDRGLSVRPPR
jgi:hypothetical protein